MSKDETGHVHPRRSGGLGGIVLVALGVLLLGANYGWWGLNFWWAMALLWPVLLILLGLRLLLPRSAVYGWIVLVLIIGLFAAAASMPERFRWVPGNPKIESSQSFRDDLGNAKRLKLELKFGAAEVNLEPAPADANTLYQAEFTDTPEVAKTLRMDGDTAVVTLRQAHSGMMVWGPRKRAVTVLLTRQLPVDLSIDSGASQVIANLRDVNVANIDIDAGAAAVELALGRLSEKVTGSVNIGASAFKLTVPKEYGLQIRHDGGLSSQNFSDEGLTKSGDTYRTQGYDSASKQINLRLDAGVSSIKLERYE